MSEQTKVTIGEVEQSLMQALKTLSDTRAFSPEILEAVDVYSQALQRILLVQK